MEYKKGHQSQINYFKNQTGTRTPKAISNFKQTEVQLAIKNSALTNANDCAYTN